jgi:hypothetical protein
MEGSIVWLALLVSLLVGGFIGFVLGSRASVSTGRDCRVDVHWYFGWWVRCRGGEGCPSGHCKLQRRRRNSEDNWETPEIVPGGSVRWNEQMEYRCLCA